MPLPFYENKVQGRGDRRALYARVQCPSESCWLRYQHLNPITAVFTSVHRNKGKAVFECWTHITSWLYSRSYFLFFLFFLGNLVKRKPTISLLLIIWLFLSNVIHDHLPTKESNVQQREGCRGQTRSALRCRIRLLEVELGCLQAVPCVTSFSQSPSPAPWLHSSKQG